MPDPKSRTARYLTQSAANALYQILTLICGLIVPRLMLTHYGSEINGTISSLYRFLSLFDLVQAGIANAAIYALYRPLGQNDRAGVNQILSAAQRCYSQAGKAYGILVFVLAILYPFFVRQDALSRFELSALTVILAAGNLVDFFTLARHRILIQADQRNHIQTHASSLSLILQTLLISVLASLDAPILLLRAAAASTIILRLALLKRDARRHYPDLELIGDAPCSLISKRKDAIYQQILNAAQNNAPVLILTALLPDLRWVSVYSIYLLCIQGVSSILLISQSGLMSAFGELIAKNELALLQKNHRLFEVGFYGLCTVLYGTTAVVILPFIRIYTRGVTDFSYDWPVLAALITLDGLLYQLKSPQGLLILSAGLYRETRWRSTLQAALLIVCGFALTPHFGILGPVLGSIVANIYRTIDLLFFVPKRVTKLPILPTLRRQIATLLVALLTAFLFRSFFESCRDYLDWALRSSLVTISALALWMIPALLFDRFELKQIWQKIKHFRSH